MPDWPSQALRNIGAAQEVHLAIRRHDGNLRSPRIIWIVTWGRRVFIRSTNGATAAWYGAATTTRAGQLTVGCTAYHVTFSHVDDEQDLARADDAYRAKYGHYASIVDHLEEPGPRAATLELHPA
jgi:hypothetical protein